MKYFCFIFLLSLGCMPSYEPAPKLVNVVGEIFQDPKLDDSNFELCGPQNMVLQYYAFTSKAYQGEKYMIKKIFEEKYRPVRSKESGLIRIRFIVNCKGESGRYRVLEMDSNYQPTKFSKEISDQLLKITTELKGWNAMEAGGLKRDYYQYLIFKIEDGNLIEIMP